MREYRDLLVLISNMEVQQQSKQVAYARMDIGGEQLRAPPRSYSELISEIGTFDNVSYQRPKKAVQPQQISQRPVQQPVYQPPAPPPAPVVEAKKVEPFKFPTISQSMGNLKPEPAVEPKVAPIQVEQPRPTPIRMPVVEEPSKSLVESASAELTKIVKESEIKVQPQPQQVYAKPANNLILPTLSIPDQVSELDKIIQNLKESNFTSQQLDIVNEEVRGLAAMIKAQPDAEATGLDRDMMELRRVRVAEAVALVGG
jgi:hypothetical protein